MQEFQNIQAVSRQLLVVYQDPTNKSSFTVSNRSPLKRHKCVHISFGIWSSTGFDSEHSTCRTGILAWVKESSHCYHFKTMNVFKLLLQLSLELPILVTLPRLTSSHMSKLFFGISSGEGVGASPPPIGSPLDPPGPPWIHTCSPIGSNLHSQTIKSYGFVSFV